MATIAKSSTTIGKIKDGSAGKDGQTTYTWVKYADTPTSGMSDNPDGKDYMGLAYNKLIPAESTNYKDYEWSLIKGDTGAPGADGTSSYTWVKYANDMDGTGFSDSPNGKTYIGMAYNKDTPQESTNPKDYTWAKFRGDDGVPGANGKDGVTTYTWLKYADTPTSGMSDDPTNKKYIGLAYNKTTATESNAYGDYQWALIKGADGKDGERGIPGIPGADGKTTYTWIKYATSATGAGLSDDPTGKSYIGLAYNKTTPTESTVASDYTWTLFKGDQGIPGKDGVTTYTWLKYADTPTSGMSDDPTNKKYIGLAYNKTTATESSSYGDYQWALIKGADGKDGAQGIPGIPGADGKTTYTWIKYANDMNGTGLSDDPTGKTYIGMAYNKDTPQESTNPKDYTWAKFKGDQGIPGKDGVTTYTWLKYADTPTSGMSNDPANKKYIGLAYNKTTATESNAYGDYQWALIKGADGAQGVPGIPGKDGKTTYTWVKYATSATGAGLSDDPTGKSYIGLAYNKTTPTESTVASDYTWTLFKGDQGIPGKDGTSVTITSTSIMYGISASGTVQPTSWQATVPTPVPGKFMWTRTSVTYSNGTSTQSFTVGYSGADGKVENVTGIISSDTPPANPEQGRFWNDTSQTPNVLKVYRQNGWVIYQLGAENIAAKSIVTEKIAASAVKTGNIDMNDVSYNISESAQNLLKNTSFQKLSTDGTRTEGWGLGIQYVRFNGQGNTANGGTHFAEVDVLNKSGKNVSLGLTATASGSGTISWSTLATNGDLSSVNGTWNQIEPNTTNFVMLNLGSRMNDLDKINIKMYRSTRKYYQVLVQVSPDATNWTTVFSGDIQATDDAQYNVSIDLASVLAKETSWFRNYNSLGQTNAFSNSEFEPYMQDWSVSSNTSNKSQVNFSTTEGYNGSRALQIDSSALSADNGDYHRFEQSVPVPTGATKFSMVVMGYVVSASSNGNTYYNVAIDARDASDKKIGTPVAAGNEFDKNKVGQWQVSNSRLLNVSIPAGTDHLFVSQYVRGQSVIRYSQPMLVFDSEPIYTTNGNELGQTNLLNNTEFYPDWKNWFNSNSTATVGKPFVESSSPNANWKVEAVRYNGSTVISKDISSLDNSIYSKLIPVSAGVTVTASMYTYSSANVNSTVTGAIYLRYYDSNKNYIAQDLINSGVWKSWQRLILTKTTPAKTAYVSFNILTNGSVGTNYYSQPMLVVGNTVGTYTPGAYNDNYNLGSNRVDTIEYSKGVYSYSNPIEVQDKMLGNTPGLIIHPTGEVFLTNSLWHSVDAVSNYVFGIWIKSSSKVTMEMRGVATYPVAGGTAPITTSGSGYWEYYEYKFNYGTSTHDALWWIYGHTTDVFLARPMLVQRDTKLSGMWMPAPEDGVANTTQLTDEVHQSFQLASGVLSSVISNLNSGYSSNFNQDSNGIVQEITKGTDLVTALNLTPDGVYIKGTKIKLDGNVYVTADFYANGGNFKNINASNINTGKLKADYIDVASVVTQGLSTTNASIEKTLTMGKDGLITANLQSQTLTYTDTLPLGKGASSFPYTSVGTYKLDKTGFTISSKATFEGSRPIVNVGGRAFGLKYYEPKLYMNDATITLSSSNATGQETSQTVDGTAIPQTVLTITPYVISMTGGSQYTRMFTNGVSTSGQMSSDTLYVSPTTSKYMITMSKGNITMPGMAGDGSKTKGFRTAHIQWSAWWGQKFDVFREGDMVYGTVMQGASQDIPANTLSDEVLPVGYRPVWQDSVINVINYLGRDTGVYVRGDGRLGSMGRDSVPFTHRWSFSYISADPFPYGDVYGQ